MRFDTAAEVTASELRVELLFPADEQSDANLRELIARSTSALGRTNSHDARDAHIDIR
jgi:hypothetical protein